MIDFRFTNSDKSAFEKLGVSAVILFGSQALGLARPNSDFDFGILLNKKGAQNRSQNRGGVFDALHEIFASHIKKLVNIDIVFLQEAPGELKAHAVKNGIAVYESEPHIFNNFKAREMQRYADFAPFRRVFQQGILSRIK